MALVHAAAGQKLGRELGAIAWPDIAVQGRLLRPGRHEAARGLFCQLLAAPLPDVVPAHVMVAHVVVAHVAVAHVVVAHVVVAHVGVAHVLVAHVLAGDVHATGSTARAVDVPDCQGNAFALQRLASARMAAVHEAGSGLLAGARGTPVHGRFPPALAGAASACVGACCCLVAEAALILHGVQRHDLVAAALADAVLVAAVFAGQHTDGQERAAAVQVAERMLDAAAPQSAAMRAVAWAVL